MSTLRSGPSPSTTGGSEQSWSQHSPAGGLYVLGRIPGDTSVTSPDTAARRGHGTGGGRGWEGTKRERRGGDRDRREGLGTPRVTREGQEGGAGNPLGEDKGQSLGKGGVGTGGEGTGGFGGHCGGGEGGDLGWEGRGGQGTVWGSRVSLGVPGGSLAGGSQGSLGVRVSLGVPGGGHRVVWGSRGGSPVKMSARGGSRLVLPLQISSSSRCCSRSHLSWWSTRPRKSPS